MAAPQEPTEGDTHYSENVYINLAAMSALSIKGVAAMNTTTGEDWAQLVGVKNDITGVKLTQSDEGHLTLDLYITVRYGYRIPDVALRVQEAVKSGIEDVTNTPVDGVNIFVQAIDFDDTIGVPIRGGAKDPQSEESL